MHTINDINIGDSCSIEKIVTTKDVEEFAKVSGDVSPIHLDEAYAEKTKFGKCIVHGMLLGAYISQVIGTKLPGEGTIYAGQELEFKKPLYIGEKVIVRVEVIEIDRIKHRVVLKTECWNEEQELVVGGKAVVLPPKAN